MRPVLRRATPGVQVKAPDRASGHITGRRGSAPVSVDLQGQADGSVAGA
jgi:hypothetical protein